MSYHKKTNITWGKIREFVRQHLNTNRYITVLDLPQDRDHAGYTLNRMVDIGELKRIKKATLGRNSFPAIYVSANPPKRRIIKYYQAVRL